MGLGVEHRLVLPLQAGLDEPVDSLEGDLFPGVPERAAVDRELPVEEPIDQGEARVFRGIGFAGKQIVDLGEHVADIQGSERPPTAFLVAGGGGVDFKIRGIGEVTS
jgi:hypothetical protein